MKAEDFIELIEQNRFDKISKNGMTLIAERFRELQSQQRELLKVLEYTRQIKNNPKDIQLIVDKLYVENL